MTPEMSYEVNCKQQTVNPLDKAVWQFCELAWLLQMAYAQFQADGYMYSCYATFATRFGIDDQGMWIWEKTGVWSEGRRLEWKERGSGVARSEAGAGSGPGTSA